MFKYTYTVTEPIEDLKEMATYYNVTSQSGAEVAISNSHYIIGSIDAIGQFSVSSHPAIHRSMETAEVEARRLASQNPGKNFVVMQLCAGFRAGGMLEF